MCTILDLSWHEEEIFLLVPDEGSRIGEDFRTGTIITERERAFLFGILDIFDIVQIDLESAILYSSVFIREGIIADTDESIRIIWMQIGRVSWHLEFSENLRGGRIREIDDKEWINLLEGD